MSTESTTPPSPVTLSPAEAVLAELLLRLSRVVLHHPRRDTFDDDPAALYRALHEFFAQARARQSRAAVFRLSRRDVSAVLRFCLGHLVGGGGGDDPVSVEAFLSRTPLVTLEGLRGLSQGRAGVDGSVMGPGLTEVVELCRLLDHRLGLPRAPLGAVHVIHLAAILATRCAVSSLGELVVLVAEAAEGRSAPTTTAPPPATRETSLGFQFVAAIYYEWGLLDPPHRDGLHSLCQRCIDAASRIASDPQGPSLVDLVRMPASLEEEKLMVSAADPIMASEHFTQMRREDHRNSSDGPDIEDRGKMSRRTTQVMDTVEAPISRTPSILQDEEPMADEIDYRFWMNLAS